MTIREVLTAVKAMKPSQYDDETLVRWMSELNARLWQDILYRYGRRVPPLLTASTLCAEATAFIPPCGISAPSQPVGPPLPLTLKDMEQPLLVAFPHDDLYVKWLCAQIDYQNAEFDRYNNSLVHFNAGLQAFADWYNRAHMPRQDAYIQI